MRGIPYYEVRLSDKGQATMKPWREGKVTCACVEPTIANKSIE